MEHIKSLYVLFNCRQDRFGPDDNQFTYPQPFIPIFQQFQPYGNIPNLQPIPNQVNSQQGAGQITVVSGTYDPNTQQTTLHQNIHAKV